MKLKLFNQIQDNIDFIISDQPPIGTVLFNELIELHPADIAQLFSYLDDEHMLALLSKLDKELQARVFEELTNTQKMTCLRAAKKEERSHLLGSLPLNELTDLLDELSDEELNTYLQLLAKQQRERVISLLQFNPESAGGIMDTNVITLQENFTVEKSTKILQRLQPSRDLHRHVFVTNQNNRLVGYINLEDLVIRDPKTIIKDIVRPNILVIQVNEDQEEAAKKMMHYSLLIAPVASPEGIFLGVISSEELIKILEMESSEDIYRMSAIVPIKGTYFETPFFKLFYQRSSILVALLLLQTFSSMIIERYEALLAGFLTAFLTMLISTGGNASNQTSALAIQGMALGEINKATQRRFITREILMSLVIGVVLAMFAFIRIYATHGYSLGNLAVSLSLTTIIIVSMTLGSCMPLILKRLNMDPAHSAGPLLATLMDIIGIFIYCLIIHFIYSQFNV